jgi:DNA replication protein DnaC
MMGKSHLAQAIGLEALKAGFVVLYRSIFDLVRELLTQETLAGEVCPILRWAGWK